MLGSSLLVVAALAGAAAPQPLEPLVQVAAERVATADQVAAAKWGTDQPIDDPAREQQVLDTMAAKATAMGVDPELTRRVFRDQIEANKVVQRGLHQYWAAHPDEQPTERPDLGEVRPVIDRLNDELLVEIRDTADVRAHPSCEGELTGAFFRIGQEMRLDPLHQAGVGRALPSVCD
ncbi:chorismate mutase [Saccharopolyspora taberi]|uniref:Chorismate mutase n=1 Tax=Saccharopolyspora taberi TaxID=60895 RepID=A0ABN3VLH5_9PSEU